MGPLPLLIVNPAAGGGRTRRRWLEIREILTRAQFRFEHVETRGPGEAVELAADAARHSVPLVVAVGGDGTLNEVINGVTDPDGPHRVTVGALLTGRGRDGCRTLGLPRDARVAAARLVEGQDISVDLGRVEWAGGRRFFVNAAGAGFDATVAARVARLGGAGPIPYVRAVVGSLRGYEPVEVLIEGDGGGVLVRGPVAGVVVANGPCFGGGMKIAPGATASDGLLDLVVLGALGRMELLCWLPTIYWGGHLRNRKVKLLRTRRVFIHGPRRVPIQVDGEPVGATPMRVSVCPGALRVRV